MANQLYPNIVVGNLGDYPMKTIFSSHANGQVMMTFPVYTNASWAFHQDATALRKMLNWGITDRMRKIRLSPGVDLIITIGSSILDEEAEGTTAQPSDVNNNYILRHEQHLHHSSSLHPEETAKIANEGNCNDISEAQHRTEATFIRPSFTNIDRNITIAPRPTPVYDLNGMEAAERDPYKYNKAELRKIRKRESAARSYRKKMAAKSQLQP